MWPFSRKRKKAELKIQGNEKARVLIWAQEQQKAGVPLMVIYEELLSGSKPTDEVEVIQARIQVADEIFNAMFERNRDGQTLEAEGRIDEAITLYEKNVADQFIGLHPYERLRIIYTKRNDYPAAVRVCRTYLELPRSPRAREATAKKTAKMQQHLEKLLQKTN